MFYLICKRIFFGHNYELLELFFSWMALKIVLHFWFRVSVLCKAMMWKLATKETYKKSNRYLNIYTYKLLFGVLKTNFK